MTKDQLYANWQAWYNAGKGDFNAWLKAFGISNGANRLTTGLQFIDRETKEKNLTVDVPTAAAMSVKYGITVAPSTGSGIKEALGGLVSGFAAGGPAGAVVGFVGGAISSDVKQKSVTKAVKQTIATGSSAVVPQVTPSQEQALSSAENLLNFKGKELWILSGLLIFGFILFFVKK